MEEKKTIFNYIGQAFAIYGIIVLIFILFSVVIGEQAEGYSALFSLGNKGISVTTLCELLLLSVMITIAQDIFLTDRWIVNMSMMKRNALFFLAVLVVSVIMIIVFQWFPIGDITAWLGFIVSYAISVFVSVLVTRLRERAENAKMQQALDAYNKR